MREKSETLQQAEKIIHKHVIWSVLAGSLPITLIDMAGVGLIQLDMLKQLCNLYKCDYNRNMGKAIVSAIIGAGLSKGLSALFGEVSAIERISFSMIAGASTYALGRIFISNFEEGVGLIDIDLKKGEELFTEEFEKGMDYVKNI